MSVSATSSTSMGTISMNGNSTAYGAVQGSELFNVTGYNNTALLAGANDTVDILGGAYDTIDLNSTGFANAVTDVINLGASTFDQIIASHALSHATIMVTGAIGPNTVALTNHSGSTSIVLGSVGDTALQGPALGDKVSLNGDASNNIAFTSGGNAQVAVGSAHDGMSQFSTAITLTGVANTVIGGDEAFTMTNATGALNTVALGDGNNVVNLAGGANVVTLGNGNNTLTLMGQHETATLGAGSNTITTGFGLHYLTFAAGGAGSTDTSTIVGGSQNIHGGDENFVINSGTRGSNLFASLGNGNNTITLANGTITGATLGRTLTNTATNTISLGRGNAGLTFNGGHDNVVLGDAKGSSGFDTVKLNATLLGTNVTMAGSFDTITLTQDANAAIHDTSVNGGLSITLIADAAHGFGTVAIDGLANDDMAQIHLVGAGAYTMTTDTTPAGGVTLHFGQGSVDLVGLQSVPNHLFGG